MKASLFRCNNRKKQKITRGSANGIERLPDEILAIILSCLTLKDAIRTSILSKRWRYLWRICSGSLDFDFDCLSKASRAKYKKTSGSRDFVSIVNQILKVHQAPSIDKFIVRCTKLPRNSSSSNCIADWIQFAIQKDVRVVEWNLNDLCFPRLEKFMSISRVWKPECANALSSLSSLALSRISIKEDMVEGLISNLPLLQHLNLAKLHGPTSLNIKTCPSLESLIVCRCYSVSKISISAPKLFSFDFIGFLYEPQTPDEGTKIEYENVPLLTEVMYDSSEADPHEYLQTENQYFKCRNQLKKLVLSLDTYQFPSFKEIDIGFKYTPKFQCLKHLEVLFSSEESQCLLYFTWLINLAPFLSTFVVQFTYTWIKDKGVKSALHSYMSLEAQTLLKTCHHEHLREVKLINLGFYRTEFRFLVCLLQIATSVEKIVIKPGHGVFGCDRTTVVGERAKQLKTVLPKDVQLIIL